MLKHCVFLNFRDDVSDVEITEIMTGLAALTNETDGMIDMKFGPNLDYENKTPDFNYGFIATFRDRDAHLAYEGNAQHIKLGGRLVDCCNGGHAGISVFDLSV